MATLFVGATAVIWALWLTDTGMTGMSTRALRVVVFALGWAACTSDAASMAVVHGLPPDVSAPRWSTS